MGSTRGEPPVREEFCEWRASDLSDPERFFLHISPSESAELGAANGSKRSAGAELAQRLAGLKDDVVFGRGFGIVRRLPVDRMSNDDAQRALGALGSHFGRVRQTFGPGSSFPGDASGADLMGVLCLRAAPGGTTLSLSCAVAVHNGLARTRPDLLDALYRPNLTGRPAFLPRGRSLSAQGLGCFDRLERMAADAEQAEAYVHACRLARASTLEVDFDPGDILFVNTHHVTVAPAALRGGWSASPNRTRSGEVCAVALGVAQPVSSVDGASERDGGNGARVAA